jgi:hypothetical protein
MFREACVFVVAGGAIGPSAGAEFELAWGEVLVEVVPFGVSAFAEFGPMVAVPGAG